MEKEYYKENWECFEDNLNVLHEYNGFFKTTKINQVKKYPKCNCKGVYLYHDAILPKTAIAEGYAKLKVTLVTKDDTCKFCDHVVIYEIANKKYKYTNKNRDKK